MKTIAALLIYIFLTSCASTDGALKQGTDTYSVRVVAAEGGQFGMRNQARIEADNYCKSVGKKALVTDIQPIFISMRGASYADVTFRCLSPGDPELTGDD